MKSNRARLDPATDYINCLENKLDLLLGKLKLLEDELPGEIHAKKGGFKIARIFSKFPSAFEILPPCSISC